MAATRASSMRVLNKLAARSKQVRQLHITGPATFPSPLLTTERSAANSARDIAGAVDASSKRPTPPPSAESGSSAQPTRQFNTSRSLKAVNDTSTIDFAYLPDFDPDSNVEEPIIVPLLPQNHSTSRRSPQVQQAEASVMRPEIVTASADSTHISVPSAMHEVHDNSTIDFQGMAGRVAEAAKNVAAPVEEKAGTIKQLWNGLVDDVFGAKRSPKA